MSIQPRKNLVKEITKIASSMTSIRTQQLYEFAMFLQSHPLPGEERLEEIIAEDEARWEAQFADTSDDELVRLIKNVEAEISQGDTFPMFDASGAFIERE